MHFGTEEPVGSLRRDYSVGMCGNEGDWGSSEGNLSNSGMARQVPR
jgi:hypothetical protein